VELNWLEQRTAKARGLLTRSHQRGWRAGDEKRGMNSALGKTRVARCAFCVASGTGSADAREHVPT
jgi:hypothetical protein